MVGQLWAASSVPVRLDLGARERGEAELGKPPIHGDTVEGSPTAYYKRVCLHTFFNMFTSSGTIFGKRAAPNHRIGKASHGPGISRNTMGSASMRGVRAGWAGTGATRELLGKPGLKSGTAGIWKGRLEAMCPTGH